MSPTTTVVSAIVVALGISPREDVARESVDLIEVNHFYDEQGRLVFDQSPGSDVVSRLAERPVVENDLVEYEPTVFVVEVVELDEINRLTGYVLLGRNPEGYKASADRGSKGTHQSPPCCR